MKYTYFQILYKSFYKITDHWTYWAEQFRLRFQEMSIIESGHIISILKNFNFMTEQLTKVFCLVIDTTYNLSKVLANHSKVFKLFLSVHMTFIMKSHNIILRKFSLVTYCHIKSIFKYKMPGKNQLIYPSFALPFDFSKLQNMALLNLCHVNKHSLFDINQINRKEGMSGLVVVRVYETHNFNKKYNYVSWYFDLLNPCALTCHHK